MAQIGRPGDVEAVLKQRLSEAARALMVALDRQLPVLRQAPDILVGLEHGEAAAERLADDLVVDADTERGNAVVLVILVLIVAPDKNDIGLERIELGAQLGIAGEQPVAMRTRRTDALVIAPFAAHGFGPAVARGKVLSLHPTEFDPALQH